jgi:uncharacterized protein
MPDAASNNPSQFIAIEIVYAKPDEQVLLTLKVPQGTTVETALELSGLLVRYPEITQQPLKVGIFGIVCSLDYVLTAGDRLEIYRPLRHDPKDARRQRALNQK